jgi:hypothetical protein
VVGCKNHEEVIAMFQGFHSSVRGIVIAISGMKGVQVYSPPGEDLRCGGE